MIHDCLAQCVMTAADINFDVDALRSGFLGLTIDGLSWGAIYALVAVGYTLVFGVLRLINFAHSEIFMLGMFGAYFALDMILGFAPSGNAYAVGIVSTIFYLIVAALFAMLVSGGAAVGLEAVAYRPLRKRNARPLTFLITAIGDVVHPPAVRALHPAADRPWLRWPERTAADPAGRPEVQFRIFGAPVTNITLIIVIVAGVRADGGRHRSSTAPDSAAASARWRRTPRPRR